MFVQNDQYPELVYVRAAHPLDGLRAHVIFSNGVERDIDLEPFLHGPLFDPIRRNPKLFAALYVDEDTIAWPNGADIDPDTLYYDGAPPWAEETSEAFAQ